MKLLANNPAGVQEIIEIGEGGADLFPNLCLTERFTVGDVIRAHDIGSSINGAATLRIRKVGV